MHSIFLEYLFYSKPLTYLLMFIGMIIEGDFLLFSVGFLVHQGLIDMRDAFVVLLSGVLVGDLLWYWLGMLLSASPRQLHKWFHVAVRTFDNHIHKHFLHTIFISKFIAGIHHPILMRIGALHISVKRFFAYDLVSSVGWIIGVGALGYASSASFISIKNSFRFVEVGLLFGLIIFFILKYIFDKFSGTLDP